MALVAYARVSTEDQSTDSQMLALRQAGCSVIFEEHASGGDRDRPVLAKALASLRTGDTLVVARIDRLARSLFHLLEVIDGLEQRGIAFKSLGDPIDTTSPQGRFALQVPAFRSGSQTTPSGSVRSRGSLSRAPAGDRFAGPF